MHNASCRSRPYGSESWTDVLMRTRWSPDCGPVRAQRTAIDSGPCADGRAGSTLIDVRVTPMDTTIGDQANGARPSMLIDRAESEADVDRRSGGGTGDFHRVTQSPHQNKTAAAV